ncbi:hypothetical protein CVT26_002950 [Gymnopilus dilepis]|uniref:Uncharacterized protein n=1 Tax=Gymnopilus dilepis TaxID=231916 RepID=A0A409Y4I0_9AGAR|nr:hypothetical protein CVT26_002950 [Gymnopilus dilepis]
MGEFPMISVTNENGGPLSTQTAYEWNRVQSSISPAAVVRSVSEPDPRALPRGLYATQGGVYDTSMAPPEGPYEQNKNGPNNAGGASNNWGSGYSGAAKSPGGPG